MDYTFSALAPNIITITHKKKNLGLIKICSCSGKKWYNTHENEVYESELCKNESCFVKMLSYQDVTCDKCCCCKSIDFTIGEKQSYMGKHQIYLDSRQCRLLKDCNKKTIRILHFEYDSNFVSLYDVCKICKTDFANKIIPVLQMLGNKLHKNNFIHGDMKLSNILVNKNNNETKFIDLETAIVDCPDCVMIDNDSIISGYLKKDGLYTKEFLFIFDIWLFIMSSVVTIENHNKVKNICNFMKNNINGNSALMNDKTAMDAMTIMMLLQSDNKDKFICGDKLADFKVDECYNASFETIANSFSEDFEFTSRPFELHYLRMQQIVRDCVRINDAYHNDKPLKNNKVRMHDEAFSDNECEQCEK